VSAATVEAAGFPDGWEPAGQLSIRGRRGKAEVYARTPESGGRRSRWMTTPWSARQPRSAP
jgi:hypothetical protein